MVIKRKALISIVAFLPLMYLSSISQAHQQQQQQEQSSLEKLKQRCLELRDNNQIMDFDIKIKCSGNYTVWEKEASCMSLTNRSHTKTQTSTKCGRYQTEQSMFSRELPEQELSCDILTKKEISLPAGFGVSVNIGSCDELTEQNLENLCQQRIHSYCEDNKNTNQKSCSSKQQSNDGLCTVREIKKINTCDSYQ